ncbi:putative F-box protein At1g50870 [Triticum dicoccoides]|uniref:putative F-box protein At1g50870 n=1 Tax=Triticum dicoccoides TaxID=85692 RepID=UPI00188F3260|nr:putative F-box protein At1g50870 [Triticum dicoccoides]
MKEAEKGEVFERNTKLRLDNNPKATAEAASLFTDDIILEILSRLPARSVHRFKCISVSWRNLIADPANRKKLPQTLAGFLYFTTDDSGHHHHFASVSGRAPLFDPCLPYLQPDKYKDMTQVDTCNGLLLYRGSNNKLVTCNWAKDDYRFVVCNPVTGRWMELPPSPQSPENRFSCIAGLAFDPAVSSHFYVLHFEQTIQGSYITAVNIYSSRTRAWTHKDSGMVQKVALFYLTRCVFVGGMMYLMGIHKGINEENVLVGVDMEVKVWKIIRVPHSSRVGTLGTSQGCLHFAIASQDQLNKELVSEIELWCLKDRDSTELVLKHTASIDKLMSTTELGYRVAEIHPDCDTIFLGSYGGDTLAAYMRHQKVGCILNLETNITLWHQFLPYVPLFSESLADADGQ